MITVIFWWIVLFIVFFAFGEMAVNIWNTTTKRSDIYTKTDKFWIGICFIGALILILSIFIPLNIWVTVTFYLIAGIYITLRRNNFLVHIKAFSREIKESSIQKKIILFAFFSVILTHSLSTSLSSDQGLYHVQTMLWAEQYSVVPGLGNLHGRLAFNSTFLLLCTVFNYQTSAFFTINGLCVLVFAFWLIQKIDESKNIVARLTLCATLLLSTLILGADSSSSSTDTLSSIFIMYLLIKWTLSEKKDFSTQQAFLIAMLTIFGVTLKLSSAVILLALLICVVTLLAKKDRRSVYAILILGLVVTIPWLTRFVVSTGYLVYPFPAIDIFSFDWKIPIEMVVAEKDITYSWAKVPFREPAEVLNMGFAEWVPLWAERVSNYTIILYSLALLSPLLVIARLKKVKTKILLLVWGVAFTCTIFNILTAPDLRFSFGILVATIATALIIISPNMPTYQKANCYMLYLSRFIFVVLLVASFFLWKNAKGAVRYYRKQTTTTKLDLILKPVRTDVLRQRSDVKFDEYKLSKDIVLFVPEDNDRCVDQTLPCTSYYNSNLELRGNELQDGFRIKK